MMRFLNVAAFILAPAALAQHPVAEIKVAGNARLPAAAVIAASGLRVGQIATRAQFDAAAQRLAGAVKERLRADGVNLINSCGQRAWQTVFHFHLHVIPRYEGDSMRLPWTPAPGDPLEIAAAAQEIQGL